MTTLDIPLGQPSTSSLALQTECRGVLEKHARSFAAAAIFLPPAMRDDAALVYALCRLIDDTADEASSLTEAERGLQVIEEMLDGRRVQSPLIAAFCDLSDRTGVGLGPAQELILGVRSDLGRVRLQNDEELFLYCYRVAGTVGLMMCGVLGVNDPQARRHAVDLGIGMQLTNICRDVLEDAVRDRVYLPRTRLLAHGVESDAVAEVGTKFPASTTRAPLRDGVRRVVSDLLEEAEGYYSSGGAGLRYIRARPRLAISVARALYREIGVTLRKGGSDPLVGRTRVHSLNKLVLVTRSAFRWLFDLVAPSRPVGSPQTGPRPLLK